MSAISNKSWVETRLKGMLWVPMAYGAAVLWPERPLHRFVVLTEGRSGSEALVTRLNSHPDILCDTEILAVRRAWPDRLIAGRVRVAGNRARKAYGFKLLPKHVAAQKLADRSDYLRRLADDGWSIIYLQRRNHLDQAISAHRASQTQFHYQAMEAPPFEPMHIEPSSLIATLQMFDKTRDHAEAMLAGLEVLKLCYEEDLEQPSDQQATINRVTTMLGLSAYPTSTDQVRIHPPLTRDMVTNYEELVAAAEKRRSR